MRIKGKFFIIVFAIIISFLISIGIYFFIHNYINDIEKEKNIIINLRIVCIKNQLEANLIQNTQFMNQLIIYKESKIAIENAFNELETINILLKINNSIEIALEKVLNLKEVIYNLNNKLVEDLDKVIADAKTVFENIVYIKLEDFYQSEKALRYYNIKNIQGNVKILIDDITILNNNLNSSLSLINSQFEIINSEIEKLKFRSYFISLIIVLFLLFICVIFSLYISNRIILSIKQVDNAIEKIAKGDFSTILDIKTNDEFKALSDNYNIFIHDLKKRVDAELDFMRTIGSSITYDKNIHYIFDLVTESALKNTNADGAIVFIVEDRKYFRVESISGFFPPINYIENINKYGYDSTNFFYKSKLFDINETLLGIIFEKKESVFIKNNKIEEKLTNNINENNLLFINSFIAFPLIISNNVIGILAIAAVKKDNYLTDLDYTHLNIFTDYVSLYIQNWKSYIELIEKKEIERDIKIASEIQKKLLPEDLIKIERVDLAAYSLPAKGVGGDYYDIIKLGDDKIAIIICDVAGKGISAALLMVMIRTIFHLVILSKKEIDMILSWINRGIIGSISTGYYATLSMLIYNYNSKQIEYSNAAHTPLLVYKKDSNKIFQVDTKGMPLGIEKSSKYEKKRFKINSGDFIVLYTDGIIEAMDKNGNQYKLNTLIKILSQNTNLSSKELVEKIKEDVNRHVENCKQFDDQTLLIMKI